MTTVISVDAASAYDRQPWQTLADVQESLKELNCGKSAERSTERRSALV